MPRFSVWIPTLEFGHGVFSVRKPEKAGMYESKGGRQNVKRVQEQFTYNSEILGK